MLVTPVGNSLSPLGHPLITSWSPFRHLSWTCQLVSLVGHPLWSHHLVGQPSLSPFGQPSWSSKLVTQVGHPSWSTQLVNQVGQPLVTPVGQPSWSSKLVTPFFSKCFRVFNKSMFKNLKSLLKNGIFFKKNFINLKNLLKSGIFFRF